jgi:8-oxo-dGTP diphosphatase
VTPPLHVVAAVLRDARGCVLLAQRPEGKADAGLWEFPGGKVDAGETALAALRRELREELAIDFASAEPLICVPVAGEGGSIRLRLDTWQVAGLSSEPRALEHAALAWVEPAELGRYPMPPADRPVVAALTMPERVLITPEPGQGDAAEAAFIESVERALERGLRRVQLRMAPADPAVPQGAARVARVAAALASACRSAGATLLLHGVENASLAARLGVGLHLRARELSAEGAAGAIAVARAEGRPTCGAVHGVDEMRHAEALGVDDLLLGPVRSTPSHPGQPGLGWERFEALRAQTVLPVFALGGVSPGDLAEARRHGAQGVAGIRGFWPDQAAR